MVDGKSEGRAVCLTGEAMPKGFGYNIAVFPRAGIKSYGGEVLGGRK